MPSDGRKLEGVPTNAVTTARNYIDTLSQSIQDYPKPGIVFRDVTPVFADGPALQAIVKALLEPFEGQFDVVAGVEARGFLLAAAAAYATGKGIVTVRKAGKLPRATYSEGYALEYGTAELEVHKDALEPGTRVLILDDVLATGGTLGAACRLMERCGGRIVGTAVLMELEGLGGREALGDVKVHAIELV